MKIELDDSQLEYLQRTVTGALEDLRLEIAAMGPCSYRECLQREQDVLLGLLSRLGVAGRFDGDG